MKLENEFYSCTISPLGAELKSLVHKATETELIWQANSDWWGRSAPVLFPIVGKLIDNQYLFKGQPYNLPQHGFARDSNFELVYQDINSTVFQLCSNPETLIVYPFDFELEIKYELDNKGLSISYKVTNINYKDIMYFSIGAHPAFNLPFILNSKPEEYVIQFEKPENLIRHKLVNGLRGEDLENLGNTTQIPFSFELFEEDALVFKGLKSSIVQIVHHPTNKSIRLTAENFPYYGIWQKKGAPFLCLEPWHGIADNVNHNKDITEKEGIIQLEPRSFFETHYQISFNA